MIFSASVNVDICGFSPFVFKYKAKKEKKKQREAIIKIKQ